MSTSTTSPSGRVRLPVKDKRVEVSAIQRRAPIKPTLTAPDRRGAALGSAQERQHMQG